MPSCIRQKLHSFEGVSAFTHRKSRCLKLFSELLRPRTGFASALFFFSLGVSAFLSPLAAQNVPISVPSGTPAASETSAALPPSETAKLAETLEPVLSPPKPGVQPEFPPAQVPLSVNLQVRTAIGILSDMEPGKLPAETGIWKPGRWIPFRLEISNSAGKFHADFPKESKPSSEAAPERFQGKIVLEMPDSDGLNAVLVRDLDVSLPHTLELTARLGNANGTCTLKLYRQNLANAEKPLANGTAFQAEVPRKISSLRDFGTLVFEKTFSVTEPAPEGRGLILTLGPTKAGVDAGVAQIPFPADEKPYAGRIASAKDLPRSLAAWELIDVLVLSTEDEETLNSWSQEETELLSRWIQNGGTFVLSLGKNAERLARDPLWSGFMPGKLEKVIPVRETAEMELFAQSPIPVTLLGVSEKYRIPVAKFTDIPPQIQVRAKQFDLPLVLRRGFGLGQIHWVTFDLAHPALENWEGRGNFVAALLEFPAKIQDTASKSAHGMEHGFDDLSGQLRSALDDFEGLRPISFGLLALFFVLYLGIIGPGCWFLCKKLPKGGELASWGLFFLTTTGSAFLLYLWAGNQKEIRVNQIQVTDYVQETASVRQSTWVNVWSPQVNRMDVSLTPDETPAETPAETPDETPDEAAKSTAISPAKFDSSSPKPETRLAWFGLPGPYLGGMHSRISQASAAAVSAENRCFIQDGRLSDVPFFARSTKSFMAQSVFQLPETSRPDFGSLRPLHETRVAGEITNPLSIPLERALLFYGSWVYEIGHLGPGETFRIDETSPYFAASNLLLEADIIEDHSIKSSVGRRRVNRPYRRDSRDLEYVARTMLFYAKAGGSAYAGLRHAYLHYLDASELLNTRTAVLYAAAGDSETQFESPLFTPLRLQNSVTKEEILTKDPRDKNVRLIRVFLTVD